MLWGNAGLVVWSAIFFPLLDTRSIPLMAVALGGMLVLQGAYIGTQPALFAELFPPAIRYSGASLGNTLGTIIGGAPAPFIAAFLYRETGSSNAVGAYITVLATVSLLCVAALSEPDRVYPARSGEGQ
jgi:MFS family permease